MSVSEYEAGVSVTVVDIISTHPQSNIRDISTNILGMFDWKIIRESVEPGDL